MSPSAAEPTSPSLAGAGALADRRLRLALDAGGLGTWEWDRRTGATRWDPKMAELFGCAPDEFDGTYEAWLAHLHPDDRASVVAEVDRAVAARRSYRLEHRVLLADGSVRWIEGAGDVTLDERGEVVGTIGCARDITARVLAAADLARYAQEMTDLARYTEAMADVGRRLIQAAEVDDVIEVALATAPILEADDVAVVLVADPDHVEVRRPGELGAAHRRSIDEPIAGTSSLREVVASSSRTFLEVAGPPTRSVLLSPLLDDERATVAVLTYEWHAVRDFDDADRNAIETLTRLCGQALRRAQIGEETVELGSIARSLAVARRTVDVATRLAEHGRAALGASVTTLRCYDAATDSLVDVSAPTPASPASGEASSERMAHMPVDVAAPAAVAVRTDAPVWIEDFVAERERYQPVAEIVDALGLGSMASMPLHSSDGSTLGVVTFGWPTQMRLGRRLRARLVALSELAAQTLERVRLHESEHEVVAAMQRQLLPQLGDHDGLEIAAHYEPASATIGMGGDWYQAVALDDGTLVAVVGDIVGHGVEAVASMSRVQTLITGLVGTGTPLGDVFAAVNTIIGGPGGTYATAVLLHLDAARGRLGYLLAGHPPPILRHPDGTVEVLDEGRQPLLGMHPEAWPATTPSADSRLVYVPLPPAAVVVAYTDGLIERRGEDIDDGIARLAAAVARSPLDQGLPAALERVVDEVRYAGGAEASTIDDLAAVAIGRR